MPDTSVIAVVPDQLEPIVEKQVFVAGQWRLLWWKFRRHKLAMVSLVIILLFYAIAAVAEFVAPMDPEQVNSRYTYAPPQAVSLFSIDTEGTRFHPHVDTLKPGRDPVSGMRILTPDASKPIDVTLWAPSKPYRLFGLVPMQNRMFGTTDLKQPVFLLTGPRILRFSSIRRWA